MKRGVVMSINTRHAVVMTPDGRFLKAPLQSGVRVGEEIVFDEELLPVKKSFELGLHLRGHLLRYASAAAVLCLLLAACLLYAANSAREVVAYVTIDINPSIEIGVDKNEKVRVLRALNSDGETVIRGMDYQGLDMETVAGEILLSAGEAHYLDMPYKDIVITSMLLDGKRMPELDFEAMLARKLDHKLQEWLTNHGTPSDKVQITTLLVPEEMRLAADSYGLSAGKMAIYLMAKSEGFQLEPEQLKSTSIHDATEPLGGVRQLVSGDFEVETRQKLQELLDEEQGKESAAATSTPIKTPAPTPVPDKERNKPAIKPSSDPAPDREKPGRHGHSRDDDNRGRGDQDRDNDNRGRGNQDRDNDNRGRGNQDRDNDNRGRGNQDRDNDNRGRGNQDRDNDNRGRGNQDRDNDNRGRGNQDRDDDNRGRGNQDRDNDNRGRGNQDRDDDNRGRGDQDRDNDNRGRGNQDRDNDNRGQGGQGRDDGNRGRHG